MGSEHRDHITQLVQDNEASALRSALKEVIARHGTSFLFAKYEHRDNRGKWPSFGVGADPLETLE